MKQIKDFKWNAVLLSELFYFDKGNQNNMGTMQDGNIPLVSAKKCDNGYKAFISENGKRLYEGHCITLNNDGDGGAGLAYYQPTKMALDSHVTALIPKVPMSKHAMLFIARSISMQRSLFGHGRSINMARLRIFRLMLPMDGNRQPDYAFMEEYMMAVEKRLLMQYVAYLTRICNQVEMDLSEKKWRAFAIYNVFSDIKRGKRLKTGDHIVGDTAYVSSSALNNGVDGFISNTVGVRIFDNCITLANSGSVGKAFYHPYIFVASDHVTKLKNECFSKYIYLFIVTVANRLSEKYSYNREINDKRLERERIMLPIDENGQPDFDYMEKYMQKHEALLLNRYINAKIRPQ